MFAFELWASYAIANLVSCFSRSFLGIEPVVDLIYFNLRFLGEPVSIKRHRQHGFAISHGWTCIVLACVCK